MSDKQGEIIEYTKDDILAYREYQGFPESYTIDMPSFFRWLVLKKEGKLSKGPLSEQGYKADNGKLRYDLLSPQSLEGLVKVLTFGAQKYADRNWEKGINYSRVFGALLRHAFSWLRGERVDPETGFNHMHHVQACAHFLAHYEECMQEYAPFNNLPAYNKPSDTEAIMQTLLFPGDRYNDK